MHHHKPVFTDSDSRTVEAEGDENVRHLQTTRRKAWLADERGSRAIAIPGRTGSGATRGAEGRARKGRLIEYADRGRAEYGRTVGRGGRRAEQ